MFKLGFFSLQDGAGCTALAVHTANFIAGGSSHSVALVEKLSTGKAGEYHRIKAVFGPDGTCRLNNVHYYPNNCGLEPDEDVIVYDFGSINFMFRFPENIYKLYICTTGDPMNIAKIAKFKEDMLNGPSHGNIKFDILLFGASKEQMGIFKQSPELSFVQTVTMIPGKKEERLDYAFASKIQNLFRISGCRLMPPECDPTMTFTPTEFYTEKEYKILTEGPAPEEVKPVKRGLFGKKKIQSRSELQKELKAQAQKNEVKTIQRNTNVQTIEEDNPPPVPLTSTIATVEREETRKANFFEIPDFDFDDVPAPTEPPPAPEEKEPDPIIPMPDKPLTDIDRMEISGMSSADIKKALKQKQKEEAEARRKIQAERAEKEAAERKQRAQEAREAAAERERIKKAEKEAEKEWKERRKAQILSGNKEELLMPEIPKPIVTPGKTPENSANQITPKKSIEYEVDIEEDTFEEEFSSIAGETKPYDVSGLSAEGLLGDVAELLKEAENSLCGLYLVARDPESLFIFTDMYVFFDKIGVLQRELKQMNGLKYAVITYKNMAQKPKVATEDRNIRNPYTALRDLDNDIRRGIKPNADMLKHHYELNVFQEVLYAE